jgi:hypothetical protein
VMAMGRRVLEASMRAIPGIYRNCQAAPLASTVQFNPVVFAEATELVEFAFRCEQVMKGAKYGAPGFLGQFAGGLAGQTYTSVRGLLFCACWR